MSKIFTTAKRKVPDYTIDFELDDDKYTFTPSSSAAIFIASLYDDQKLSLKVQLDWLEAGLPEDQAARLRERLLDPHDDADMTEVMQIINYLLEEMTDRPTTPSAE